jgi:GNAT superfamily N-acetyltransferase
VDAAPVPALEVRISPRGGRADEFAVGGFQEQAALPHFVDVRAELVREVFQRVGFVAEFADRRLHPRPRRLIAGTEGPDAVPRGYGDLADAFEVVPRHHDRDVGKRLHGALLSGARVRST